MVDMILPNARPRAHLFARDIGFETPGDNCVQGLWQTNSAPGTMWKLSAALVLALVVLPATVLGDEKYLYEVMEPEDRWPVKEFTEEGYGDSTPFLLSEKATAHRIVEFYAPWCP